MSPFGERLRAGPPLLLDGGMGTMLMARGLPAGVAPELWNVERPDDVRAVHAAYVEAGADGVHTNTFGANPERLAKHGLADRLEELIVAGVRAARLSGATWVLGDVGPSGVYLPPVGTATPEAWREGFERQGRALVEAGVDALHIETMSDRREALAALEALTAVAPGVPVMVSLTYDRKKRGFFTAFGDSPGVAAAELLSAGAAAVGANCSLSSRDMGGLAEELLGAAEGPTLFQPNAGRPEATAEGVRYDQSPEEFAAEVASIASLGAAAVGGCCGTDPAFIRALRALLPSSVPAGEEGEP